MSKISYNAKIKSKSLFDFTGEVKEPVVVESKPKMKVIRSLEAVKGKKTPFEKEYGCMPDEIVLTKQEEERWCLRKKLIN